MIELQMLHIDCVLKTNDLRIFGRCSNGKSVCVYFPNQMNYCYVRTTREITSVIKHLNKKVFDKIQVSRCKKYKCSRCRNHQSYFSYDACIQDIRTWDCINYRSVWVREG